MNNKIMTRFAQSFTLEDALNHTKNAFKSAMEHFEKGEDQKGVEKLKSVRAKIDSILMDMEE